MITICVPSIGEHSATEECIKRLGVPYLIGDNLGNASFTRRALAIQAETDWVLYVDADITFDDDTWFSKIKTRMQPDTAIYAHTIWRHKDYAASELMGTLDCQCMLVEKKYCHLWDKYLGTEKGVIGGDGESEDFLTNLRYHGVNTVCSEAIAIHNGITREEFCQTDRANLGNLLLALSSYKKGDPEFFKDIVKVPCGRKNYVAEGYDLLDCIRPICNKINLDAESLSLSLRGLV